MTILLIGLVNQFSDVWWAALFLCSAVRSVCFAEKTSRNTVVWLVSLKTLIRLKKPAGKDGL